MPAGLLIRLRPTGPWRIGPDSGDRDRVDRVFHSDSFFSACSSAMAQLGLLEEWLDATARAAIEPAVRLGSLFPFQGDTLYVTPPSNLWPPPASSKVRWKGARFVPLSVVEALLAGRAVSEDRWSVDGSSECLVPMAMPTGPGPFRVSVRSSAAADRNGAAVAPHSTACLEFTPSSGLWTAVSFSGNEARERWTAPLTAAIRLLADSGMGGERSRGWGRSEMPEIKAGQLPGLLLRSAAPTSFSAPAWWLLSLFHPASTDWVDWSQGNYSLTTRGGRVESAAGWGDAKKATRMVTEGSVIVAAAEPRGAATDVAPDGFAHPVYRSGFALAIQIPLRVERVAPSAVAADATDVAEVFTVAAVVVDEEALEEVALKPEEVVVREDAPQPPEPVAAEPHVAEPSTAEQQPTAEQPTPEQAAPAPVAPSDPLMPEQAPVLSDQAPPDQTPPEGAAS